MLNTKDILEKYIAFFEKRGHKKIPNSPLIPENDPTTLFTSSGMQPLVPYLLGEPHPQGKRLVNVQNCFRAQDIDEVGDNRHTTFFRMLGNWSLGDYFKKEQLAWFFEFLTNELGLSPDRLYVSVFDGYDDISRDNESAEIWGEIFSDSGIDPKGRIHYYGVEENWWSRAGTPERMPPGEPGGPDSEVFFDFFPQQGPIGNDLKKYSHNGRLLEIGNSVFMQYQKREDGSFKELPQRNVDFGGGLERILAAVENKQDIFQTSLFLPIVQKIEILSKQSYSVVQTNIRIIIDHFVAATFIVSAGVTPSNKEQGYILRRLIRRGLDNLYMVNIRDATPIIESIVEQYKNTDEILVERYEKIKNLILEESQIYEKARSGAVKFLSEKYPEPRPLVRRGDEILGETIKISALDAFKSLATYGTAPTQLRSLGYDFDQQELSEIIKKHQEVSRKGANEKFHGGLADTQEKTIMGHTATHLLHQALRDVLGDKVHQTGSNITTERVRFDFNYDKKLTDEEIQRVEEIVNDKIRANLAVHFEMLKTEEAKKLGAIGLFDDTYQDKSKIYFIGPSAGLRLRDRSDSRSSGQAPYSVEFCGGPHVDFTGRLKSFKIVKQENIGHGQRRIYAKVKD